MPSRFRWALTVSSPFPGEEGRLAADPGIRWLRDDGVELLGGGQQGVTSIAEPEARPRILQGAPVGLGEQGGRLNDGRRKTRRR